MPSKKWTIRKKIQKDIARQRIRILLTLIEEKKVRDASLIRRYSELVRKISMRNKVRIPKEWRWRFCKKCKIFLVPGVNSYFRLSPRGKPHIVMHCYNCGAVTRYPYK